MPGTSPQVAPLGRAPQPGTRRYGAACPDAAIPAQMTTIPAAATTVLMGCIIDWTDRPESTTDHWVVAAEISRFQAEKSDHGPDDPGDNHGKAFVITQAQPCLVLSRQTSTPHATSRKR